MSALPVEYVRPVSGLNEGTFRSSRALEAGGDDMADDSMGDEQMVYDGTTGNDADVVPAKIPTNADSMSSKIPDGVDAGGQAYTVEVETMDMDEGDGSEVLVEPGQAAPPPPPPQRAPAPPVFRPANGNGANGNGGNGANGVHRNGVHPGQNGAQRNGAPVAARNGVQRPPAPRNRMKAAFENGAPLVQGTGAATAVDGAQNYEPGGPTGNPNPAGFGWGMGQTQPDPGVEFATSIIKAGANVGSAAIASRSGLPQFQPAPGMPQPPQGQSAPTNYTPWIIGFGVLGAIGLGIWWLKRGSEPKPEPRTEVAPPARANPLWRSKAKVKKKKFRKTS